MSPSLGAGPGSAIAGGERDPDLARHAGRQGNGHVGRTEWQECIGDRNQLARIGPHHLIQPELRFSGGSLQTGHVDRDRHRLAGRIREVDSARSRFAIHGRDGHRTAFTCGAVSCVPDSSCLSTATGSAAPFLPFLSFFHSFF